MASAKEKGGNPGGEQRLLVVKTALTIESQEFTPGMVVGEIKDDQIIATAPRVEPGQIQARMARGLIVEGNPAEIAEQAKAKAATPVPPGK